MTNPFYKLIQIDHLTNMTYRLRLTRNDFKFTAGQCVNLGRPESGVNREYSIYSGANDDYLEFLIREVEDGIVSTDLKKLKPGDLVDIDGPYGEFTLVNPDADNKYLFIASGTGIAPFHSFVKTYPDLDYTILHGIRQLDEAYDADTYKTGRYISCVSRETSGNFHGRVTEYLKQNRVFPDTICYLCGNRGMISEAYDILRAYGVSGDNLNTEVFF
ncbi:oxidoreductase [bacterium]|nr:oxidoreductase [bacterium]